MQFLNYIWVVLESFGPIVMALIGLIVLDVLLAVAVAIRTNTFEWSRLAEFYKTMVIPLLIGWVGFIILTRMASEATLGPVYGALVGKLVAWAAWLAVVATIGASIVNNAKTLYGKNLPFTLPEPEKEPENAAKE